MSRWLTRLPWPLLIGVALFLGLAPFSPEPHLLEKGRLLVQGRLSRSLDIFDLCYHALPLMLIAAKLVAILVAKKKR
ncbi:hypothetical protein [Desulfogranum mediterraneum]|uniref:hypothetical protein n=1 Tax=Desulfogranum mediterraneum TaxID=160661 RepID=UPI0003F96D12|nr:hypothetical protein [Desulfogranum mediterraneum]